MSLNINGWETDDATKIKGVKLHRWVQLRSSMQRNDVHVLGLQEHHYKAQGRDPGAIPRAHDRLEQGTKRMRGQKWSMVGNLSLTPKSGVLIMWQHDRWTLRTSYSTDARTLICEFEDEDGATWTAISVHFHHDPAPRRKQWARLVAALQDTEATNIVLMADHNSVLHETLDSINPLQESGEDTHHRTGTKMARLKEQEAYGALQLMDTWPLIYEPTHQRDSMGLTYPAVEPRRRIDRVSVSTTLQQAVTGVYNVSVGQADHLAVVTQLRPEEDDTGAGRRTIQPDIIRGPQFQEGIKQVFAESSHLQGEQWWHAVMEGAHKVSREVKRAQKKWNSGIRGMEEALRDCSIFKLNARAKELLAEEGIDSRSAVEAYQQLSHLMEKSRRAQHRTEVLAMAKEQLNDEREYEPATREARRNMAAKLLKQLVTKKQMAAVKDQDGRLCTGAKSIGQALSKHWQSVMQSPNKGLRECQAYIQGCEPPEW